MECPDCHKENPPQNKFCTLCGRPLTPSRSVSEAAPAHPTTLEELRQLRGLLQQVDLRLSALERSQGVMAGAAPVPQPLQPQREYWEPVPQAPSATREPRPPRKPSEWEQVFGGNWLARIGALALLLGIGFFLKFAFDRNWIGPTLRIVLGIVAGLGMLEAGYLWRKRYPVMTQALSGLGVGVLYLSVFASFSAYDMIPLLAAAGLLLVVCAASVFLALRYDSMGLAILGVTGAFLAPFFLWTFTPSGPAGVTGSRTGILLMAYIILVDLGVLAVASFRNWRWFTLLALLFSLILYANWAGLVEATVATREIILTVLFLIFVGATTLFHIIWRHAPRAFDYVLIVANAVSYTGISLGILWSDYRAWLGGFILLLALFFAGLGYLARRGGAENRTLSLFALGIAIVLLTMAAPIQFGDRAWTTVAWAAEAAVLIWLWSYTRLDAFRWFGYAAYGVMALRLLFFDAPLSLSQYAPIANERALAFLVGIAAMYAGSFLIMPRRATLPESETRAAAPALIIAANVFTILLLSLEIISVFDREIVRAGRFTSSGVSLRNFQNLSITGLWAIYALLALVVGIGRRARFVRLGALAVLMLAIGKVFVYDVFALATVFRIVAFSGLGVLLLVAGYLYQRYKQNIIEFLSESPPGAPGA